MLLDKDNLKRDLRKVMGELKEQYDTIAEQSWNDAVNKLQPGEPVPKRGTIYGPDNIQAFNSKRSELQKKANGMIEDFISSIKTQSAAAPSDEALRSVQMAALIDPDTVGREAYADMLDGLTLKHGDLLSYEAIRSIAKKADINDFQPHQGVKALQAKHDLPRNVNNFFNSHSLSGGPNDKGISDGELSFVSLGIDRLIEGL